MVRSAAMLWLTVAAVACGSGGGGQPADASPDRSSRSDTATDLAAPDAGGDLGVDAGLMADTGVDAAAPAEGGPPPADGNPDAYAAEAGPSVDGAAGGVTAAFDFSAGAQGWVAGFSDYSPGGADYELDSGVKALPAEIGGGKTGFFITGNNHSDDLFMFLKKRLGAGDGLRAGEGYRVAFDLTFASNARSGCTGIGGAPGESVTLKAGASTVEPQTSMQGSAIVLNVDKGMQTNGGADASVVGNIANGMPCSGAATYVSLHRVHTHPTTARADASGNLWLIVGTDSGFEGTTALYYQSIDVTLTPVP